MPDELPTTIAFPRLLEGERRRDKWRVHVDGRELALSNLDKVFWRQTGYTKADLVTYYFNVAERILPYLRDRPLTLKRMPDGAEGEFFYAKQAPAYTPAWVATAAIVSEDSGKRIDYLLAQDTASLLWLANLACIEMHVWHARVDDLAHPDYAFFDLDPMGEAGFDMVREVALLVRTALDRLGIRGYPRTSGATGLQVYVPLERVHTAEQVREWVGRVCKLIHRADPQRTTMTWDVASRGDAVFLDHNMNTEGKNIAATWSARPAPLASVATPLTWDEVAEGIRPEDFTIATVWERLAATQDPPILGGGQDLRAAMSALGMDPDAPTSRKHHVATDDGQPGELRTYAGKRDFARTPEPPGPPPPDSEPASGNAGGGQDAKDGQGRRFVVQHHLATRLHHDLRLERGGVAKSWAVPKGLPDVPGLRHRAVQTEDHPLEYLTFSGEIPEGEYGAGPVRIWDEGTYEALEWRPGKVTFRLQGRRHRGEWHLFHVGPEDKDWMVVRAGDPASLPPPPPALQPMLAATAEGAFDDPAWVFEVKWDGVRAVATVVRPGAGDPGTTRLVSRNGNDVSAGYPELADVWQRVLARNAVLDGEIVALDAAGRPSFQRLQQRMHLRAPGDVERARARVPVTYMVFDLLALDGEALIDRPWSERDRLLDEVLVPGGVVQRSEAVPEQGKALYEAAAKQGLEGLVAKRAASLYRPGRRSRDWLKVKVRRQVDVVVGGWMPGEGSRSGRLGSLLVGLYDDEGRLQFAGRVGTGFDEAELERVGRALDERVATETPFADRRGLPPQVRRHGRWVRPELVCRVEYAETTGDGKLRAPSYKGLRSDADPRHCLLEDLPD